LVVTTERIHPSLPPTLAGRHLKPIDRNNVALLLKLEVARALVSGEKRLAQSCREHSLCKTVLPGWRKRYEEKGEAAFEAVGHSPEQDDKARIRALEESL
jgi:hypothetical protein